MRSEVAEFFIFEEWKPDERIRDIIERVTYYRRGAASKCKLRTVTDPKKLEKIRAGK
jgi:hypothetical protein